MGWLPFCVVSLEKNSFIIYDSRYVNLFLRKNRKEVEP